MKGLICAISAVMAIISAALSGIYFANRHKYTTIPYPDTLK